jgi:KDO2-lipid IV(A) lauroyltransferase
MVCEVAHIPRKIHNTNWRRHVTMHRKRELVARLLETRSNVLVTGHFGNFELAGYFAGLLGFPTFTVARPLDNPHLDKFVNDFRGAKGQYILPKQGSAPQVEAVLDRGGIFSLLGDQHGGKKGCWVEFLGRPASCHKAIALFPLLHGAPLLVCYARRTTGPMQFEIGMRDAADPRTWDEALEGVKPLTQWYNRALGELILENPDQYWWLHRRWKGSPRKGRRKSPPAATAGAREAA